jgi:hypothetical protein
VLVAIPLLFAVALAAHVFVPVSMQSAVAAGAVGSLALLVDALYVNPPAETDRSTPGR